jgi:hypothetical protein
VLDLHQLVGRRPVLKFIGASGLVALAGRPSWAGPGAKPRAKTLTDRGAGVDTLTVAQKHPKTLLDTGVGVDSLQGATPSPTGDGRYHDRYDLY